MSRDDAPRARGEGDSRVRHLWALTMTALAFTGASLIAGDNLAGWAFGIGALSCTAAGTRAGTAALGSRIARLRQARAARRGWTADDEAVLRGERELR